MPRNALIVVCLSASTWEIRSLNTEGSSSPKCVVTLMLEISPSFWGRWKRRPSSNFDKSIPFALLSQVAGWLHLLLWQQISIYFIKWKFCLFFLLWTGLREYFAANPALTSELPSTVVKSKASESLIIQSELEDSAPGDEFYDALTRGESFEDEDSDDDDATSPKVNTIIRN